MCVALSILDLRSEKPIPEPATDDALDETPPGLNAIRAWIRKPRPRLHGVWLWIRWILAWVAKGYRFAKQNAGPAAKRLRQIASEGERVSRTAARAGDAVRDIGGAVTRGARVLRAPDGRIGRAGARLGEIGGAVRRVGGQMTEGGGAAAELFAGVGRLTHALRANEPAGLGLLDRAGEPESDEPATPEPRAANREARQRSAPRRPKAVAARDDEPEPPPTPPRPEAEPPRASVPARGSRDAESPKSEVPEQDRLAGLPDVLVPWVKGLKPRARRDSLRALILEICSRREWTTPAELARWLAKDRSNLVKRHLRPMLREGLLELRYPDRRSSPKQAYRALRRSAPDVGSHRAPNSGPEPPPTCN